MTNLCQACQKGLGYSPRAPWSSARHTVGTHKGLSQAFGQPKRMASVWRGEGPDTLAETAALTVSSASSDGECYLDVAFSLKNSSE